MGEISSIIRYLYEKFLLRDLLSFITPGAIVVSSVLLLWWCPSQIFYYLDKIHWILYIPIFGFLYLVGYAVFCLGGVFITTFSNKSPIILHDRIHGRRVWEIKFLKPRHNIRYKFQQIADDKSSQELERIIVHKQMAGIGSLAVFIAVLNLGINLTNCSWWPLFATILLAAVLLLSLYFDHRRSVLNERIWEDMTLKEQRRKQRSIKYRRFFHYF